MTMKRVRIAADVRAVTVLSCPKTINAAKVISSTNSRKTLFSIPIGLAINNALSLLEM
jgi:hypothetical protein